MKKYEFRLAPGYCLSNGIAVLEQDGASIKFLLKNLDDENLKKKLRTAFCAYLDFVKSQEDCTMNFRKIPHVEFIGSNRKLLLKYAN